MKKCLAGTLLIFFFLPGTLAENLWEIPADSKPFDMADTLRPEEKAWLASHKTLRVAGPKAFPPFHFYDDKKEVKGIAADYLNLIARILHVQIETRSDLSWPQALKGAREKEIDLIALCAKSEEREDYLVFTKPFLSYPLVIVTRTDAPFVSGINDLHGKKIVFVKGIATYDWLIQDKINIVPDFVETPLDALKAISLGKADATLENLAAASYLIQSNGLANLKIAAPTVYGQYELFMAIRKDWPELSLIINKVLAAITPDQHAEIRNRWLSVRYEHGLRKSDVLKWAAGTGGGVVLILFLFYLWNRKLKNEILERRRAEKELMESEIYLKKAQSIGKIGHFSFDPATGIVSGSDELFRIFDVDRGKPLFDAFASAVLPEDSHLIFPMIEKALSEEIPYDTEHRIRHRDGKVIHVQAKGGIIGEGSLRRMVGTVQDITDQKLSANALKASEERYRSLVEDQIELVSRFTPDGTFLFANTHFCRFFGKTRESVVNQKWQPVIHSDDLPMIEKELTRLSPQNPVVIIENRVYAAGGELRWVQFSNKAFFDKNEAILEIQSVGRDITDKKNAEEDRKKMEAQLIQSQKMESIGTLAGGIAHDFNNILSPIVGHSEMLMEDLPENSPLRSGIRDIYTAALRARDLVRQILTFSRRDKLEPRLIQLEPVAKDALKLIRATIPKTIQIEHYFEPGCGLVQADPTQIHQIVMNLATNAFHVVDEHTGRIVVSLSGSRIPNGSFPPPGLEGKQLVCLAVADNGPGMTQEVLDRIFEPFFTTKERGKGTGMGLSVVHGIVKSLDGMIDVDSSPGKGTEFRVYLPVASGISEIRLPDSGQDMAQGNERILLVDDEASITVMTKKSLERFGYTVTAFTKSTEALEAFRQTPDQYDLVITDMAMPEISGDRLIEALIRIRPGIPVILCTGLNDSLIEDRIRRLGIRGFLMKPMEMRALAWKIREILDQSPA